MEQFPYRDVFNAVEKQLINLGSKRLKCAEVQRELDKFKKFGNRQLSDDEYFSVLVFVTFYSGFKAQTVTNRRDVIQKHFCSLSDVAGYTEDRIRSIMLDPEMIKHERKIRACVENAKKLAALKEKYGSIKQYIDSHSPLASFENLLMLKESLEATFDYLGGITVYHFMTDIGLPVLKPDRVITRIFHRLGLLESERQLLKASIHGRKFAEATGHPVRYIDIIFVVYGQISAEEFGITNGICLTKPRCDACPDEVRRLCRIGLTIGSTRTPT